MAATVLQRLPDIDQHTGADHRQLVQDALDALPHGGAVHLDGSGANALPWTFYRPVIVDRPFLSLTGNGPHQTMLRGKSCFGPVVNGLANVRKASLSHWGNASNRLDGSLGRVAYGHRTKSPTGQYARLSFSGSPFSEGPHAGWAAVRKLTLDFGFVLHAANGNSCNLFGCQATPTHQPAPYYCYSQGGITYLDLRTTTNPRLRVRLMWAPFATMGQMTRLSVQLDLDAGTALAWANGSAVATTTDGVSLAGVTLHQPDEGYPFGVAALGPTLHASRASGADRPTSRRSA